MKVRVKCWLKGDETGCVISPGAIGVILERYNHLYFVAFNGYSSIFRLPVNSPLVEVIGG